MMTYIALSKTDRIKAAVVVGGLVDCIQQYNEREQGMKQIFIELIGGAPIQKETEYKLRSANYWPEKINTPILILHGDADQNVNVTQAQNLAEKLKASGKTYKLVIYREGSHGLREYPETKYEVFSWFTNYLPGVKFKTPYIGIMGLDIDSKLSSTLQLRVENGVYIIGITAGSPAEKAGLKQSGRNEQGQLESGGDIILKVDNVSVAKVYDLLVYLYSKQVGDVVSLSIYRGGQIITVPIQLEEMTTLSRR